MRISLARLGGLIVACMIAVLVAAAPAANAAECTKIKGSGSSLQNVGQEAWDAGFAALPVGSLKLEEECTSNPTNTYVSTSSGEGLEQFGANEGKLGGAKGEEAEFPEFIGSDVGAEKTQLENMRKAGGSTVMSVPVAQSAISVDVSLPENCTVEVASGKHPRISNAALAAVYSLDLPPSWPSVIENVTFKETTSKSCKEEPIRLARASASGTTCGFKRFFADLNSTKAENNSEWKTLVGNVESCLGTAKSQWPTGTLPVEVGLIEGTIKELKKGSNLVAATFENPNMISYADLADAIATGKFLPGAVPLAHSNKQGLPLTSFYVEVGNGSYGTGKAGASPEGTSGESNCAKAAYPTAPEVEPGAEWSKVAQTNLEKSEGYPICTLTYDFVWQNYGSTLLSAKYSLPVRHTVLKFLHYIVLKLLGQSLLGAKHYAALPEVEIAEKAENGVLKNWKMET